MLYPRWNIFISHCKRRSVEVKKTIIINKILIIGGDHHNTLAVARCLKRNNCDIKLLIHDNKNKDKVCIRHSNCVTSIDYVEDSEHGILKMLREYEFRNKTVLFPCSDLAAYTIDAYYNELYKKYIIPGFKNQPGKVCLLMNKWEQKKLAERNKLPMAKTWIISQVRGFFCIPDDIIYPCIIKPIKSIDGKKSDIRVCENEIELKDLYEYYIKEKYNELIIQQFLKKQYEVCAYGCLLENGELACGIVEKVREWPPKGGGSLTLAKFINDDRIERLNEKVTSILFSEGYRGQFDIEYFVCEDDIYLNEINFRHSGNGYALIKNNVNSPYYTCLEMCSAKLPNELKMQPSPESFHMDEIAYLSHIRDYGIPFSEWIKEFFHVKAFAVFDVLDLPGTFAFYIPHILPAFKRMIRRNHEKKI